MSQSRLPVPRRHFLARSFAALTAGAWVSRSLKADRAEAAPQSNLPYIGEIKMFAGWFAPAGWMFCHGQLLPISENDALFNLIGTTYGGDGQETFALPDLRGRAPIHMGTGPGGFSWQIGQTGGSEQETLTLQQIPAHSHVAGASTLNGTSNSPGNNVPARSAAGVPQYGTDISTSLAAGALLPVGGTTPHNNMQPYLGINYIISLFGVFPSPF